MGIELTALHWIYVVFIVLIILFMVKRLDNRHPHTRDFSRELG